MNAQDGLQRNLLCQGNANTPSRFFDRQGQRSRESNGVTPEYDIRIYKNVYACCGVGGLDVIIEVAEPEEEKVRAIDLRALSRILEFCEKEGYEVGHHSFEQYESM